MSTHETLSKMVGITPNMDESFDVDAIFQGDNDKPDGLDESHLLPCGSQFVMPDDSAQDDNIVHFADDDFGLSLCSKSQESQRKIAKELEKLQFQNPGSRAMNGPIAYRRARRNAGSGTRTTKNKGPEKIYHDRKGRLVIPGGDVYTLCDCMNSACPGCHWPCFRCGGRMCGPICQQGRNKYISKVTQQGSTGHVVYNPYLPQRFK